jgi:outer membrane protein assembly factor BamB
MANPGGSRVWLFVVATTLMVGVQSLPAADWPRLGGPAGTFASPETGLARAWPTNGPKVLWMVNVSHGFAGPSVHGGEVFLLDRPDATNDLLRCFSLASGQELWSMGYAAPGTLPFAGSRNVPTVDAGHVFAVGPFGHLTCVDRHTHALLWQRHLVDEFKDPEVDRAEAPTNRADTLARAQVPMWGLTQAPLLHQGSVIVAPQTQKVGLVAYDQASGKLRWQSPYIGRNWYSHVSPALMQLDGVDQVIMLAQPSDPEKSPADAPPAIISSVDPATGQLLWTTRTPGPYKIPISQPMQVGNNRLFLTGGYGMGCLMLEVRREANGWTNRVVFHNREVAAHIHAAVLLDQGLVVSSFKEHGARNVGLVWLDFDGNVRWQTGPSRQYKDGALLAADGLLFAMHGNNGQLDLLEVSPNGQTVLAEATLLDGPEVWAPLALSEGKLLVRDHEHLKCLDVRRPAP